MSLDYYRDFPADGSSCQKPRFRQGHLAEWIPEMFGWMNSELDTLRWNKSQTWKSQEEEVRDS